MTAYKQWLASASMIMGQLRFRLHRIAQFPRQSPRCKH